MFNDVVYMKWGKGILKTFKFLLVYIHEEKNVGKLVSIYLLLSMGRLASLEALGPNLPHHMSGRSHQWEEMRFVVVHASADVSSDG